jgi:hypothetical protein
MIKTCQYHDPCGNKSGNKGIYINFIYCNLNQQLDEYEKQVKELV